MRSSLAVQDAYDVHEGHDNADGHQDKQAPGNLPAKLSMIQPSKAPPATRARKLRQQTVAKPVVGSAGRDRSSSAE
ncbi:hypothetical protein JI59_23825 (plasmid) [Novosphingobium pentaromativorans US6-1]|nr:hypothetical protein JI59_23825 [Novosphingobium pentaromativorans US6-1]